MGEYIPQAGKGTAGEIGNLPGMGGIFNHINGNLYHYAGNNPLRYTDPTGRDDEDTITLSQSELDKINTLHPEIREDVKTMLLNLKKEGVDVELTLTTRTYEESMIKMAKKTGIKILMICKFMDKNIGLYVSDSLNIPFERYNHFSYNQIKKMMSDSISM